MEFDLKRQWRDFYRNLTWRRLARDRAGAKVLRVWVPVWHSFREVYFQLDLQGRWINTHHAVRGVAGKLLHVNPRLAGGGIVGVLAIAGVALIGLRSPPTRHEAASASSLSATAAATHVTSPAPVEAAPEPVLPPQKTQISLEEQFARAKAQCLERLYATDAYHVAKSEVDRLEEMVKLLREQDPERQLPKTSLQWMEAKNVIARMVSTALAEDAQVQQAEQVLLERGVLRRGKRIYVFESGKDRGRTIGDRSAGLDDKPVDP
jgi:hypothetical protein